MVISECEWIWGDISPMLTHPPKLLLSNQMNYVMLGHADKETNLFKVSRMNMIILKIILVKLLNHLFFFAD